MVRTVFDLVADVLHFVGLVSRSHARVAAENLFLRKQLAMYLEREAKPRRASNATRLTLVVLTRFIEWREALPLCNRTRSIGGTATPFALSGAGSFGGAVARGFRRMSST
jgi:hypothetical protein